MMCNIILFHDELKHDQEISTFDSAEQKQSFVFYYKTLSYLKRGGDRVPSCRHRADYTAF